MSYLLKMSSNVYGVGWNCIRVPFPYNPMTIICPLNPLLGFLSRGGLNRSIRLFLVNQDPCSISPSQEQEEKACVLVMRFKLLLMIHLQVFFDGFDVPVKHRAPHYQAYRPYHILAK